MANRVYVFLMTVAITTWQCHS